MKKRLIISILISLILSSVLTGCNNKTIITHRPVVKTEKYEKSPIMTTEVKKGDISPVFTLYLQPDNYEVTTYCGGDEVMEVDEILVEENSHVKENDILIKFKRENEEAENKLRECENRLSEDLLLIDHYSSLQLIDPKHNHFTDIEMLKNDADYMEITIEELKKKDEDLSIVSKGEGIVSFISEDLYSGFAKKSEALIRVVSGSDKYIATTEDDYRFNTGDIFNAISNNIQVEMRVCEVIEDGNEKTVIFEPVLEGISIKENSTMIIDVHKEKMKDVIYVNSDAIVSNGEESFVYLVDENENITAREVSILCQVGEDVVIESGLSGGELVAVK